MREDGWKRNRKSEIFEKWKNEGREEKKEGEKEGGGRGKSKEGDGGTKEKDERSWEIEGEGIKE